MTLEECYAVIGGDYEGMLARMHSEALVRKFAIRFLDDKTFESFQHAVETGDGKAAFAAAHTLKGLSQNLGFTRLYEASQPLTEALRGGSFPVDEALVQNLVKAYQDTVDGITAMTST